MADWPLTVAPSYGMEEEYYKPQIRAEFENGAVTSRARATKGKRRWPRLTWPALSAADWATLQAFFESKQGATFTWPHPRTAVVHTVRFSGNSLSASYNLPGRVAITLGLEEA